MKYLHLIIFSMLLSACAGAVTATPTATNTPKPPTVTATFTLVPTITPNPIPIITNVTAWKQELEDAKIAEFGSWDAYLQTLDFTKNGEDVRQLAYSEDLPVYLATARAKFEVSGTAKVTNEYLLSKGYVKKQVTLMTLNDTQGPTASITGLYKADGTFLPILTYVGSEGNHVDIQDPDDIERYMGKMMTVEVIDKLAYSLWIDPNKFGINWEKLKNQSSSELYFSVFESRNAEELEAFNQLIFGPDSYAMNKSLDVLIRKPPEDLPKEHAKKAIYNLALLAYMQDHNFEGLDEGLLIPFQVQE